MNRLLISLAIAGALLTPAAALACGPYGAIPDQPLETLLVDARSPHAVIADDAITALRARGPEAVDAMMTTRASLEGDELRRHDLAMDRVARQLHASRSGLYWYTDLEAAKARAQAIGKPILSLRLLGKLDEVLSCANSRFFRTILYADPTVAEALRDGFVMHWEPVREQVPIITIDLGNGRRIERTITGNSLHYILDADGRVVDALPGLYGPEAFLAWTQEVGALAQRVGAMPAAEREAAVRRWHQERAKDGLEARRAALGALGVVVPADLAAVEAASTDAVTIELASQRRIALSEPTRELIAAAGPPSVEEAMPIAASKMFVETPMMRMIRNLGTTIARDEVQNDLLRVRIHAFLGREPLHFIGEAQPETTSLSDVTRYIYAELFKSPLDDPYFGMAPPDVYAALPGGGLTDVTVGEARQGARGAQ